MNFVYVVVRKSEIIYIGSNIRVAKDKARAAKAPLVFKMSVTFEDFVPQFWVTSIFVWRHKVGIYEEYQPDSYHRWFHDPPF